MVSILEEGDEEATYEYTIGTKSVEYMMNMLQRKGYYAIRDGWKLRFTSNALLDMRSLKERGLIEWYRVEKLERKTVYTDGSGETLI